MRPNSIYKPHPAIFYGQTVVKNVVAEKGMSVQDFHEVLANAGISGKDRQRYLMDNFKVGQSSAMNLVAAIDGELNGEGYDPDADVDAMFGGKREWMRPIYDAVLEYVLSLGADVWVSPCQKFVPFYRGQKFAEIHSETNTRMRLYILVDGEFEGFGPVPPRVDKYNLCRDFLSVSDFDASSRAALKRAYELRAGARFPWGNGE